MIAHLPKSDPTKLQIKSTTLLSYSRIVLLNNKRIKCPGFKENSFCKCQLESELISSNGISTFLTNSPYTHSVCAVFFLWHFLFFPSSFPSLSVGCSKQERWVSNGSLWSDNKHGMQWEGLIELGLANRC